MKNVILTGASGFIGRSLINNLLSKEYMIVAIVPDPENLSEFDSKKLTIVKASYTEFDTISDKIPIKEYSEFYYLAWSGYGKFTNDYQYQINNIKPACDAIILAKKVGCKRFIFASSFSEYMVAKYELKSHHEGASSNVYGSVKHATRLIAHSVAKQQNLEFLSVAFANTFGPGDYSKRSTNMIIKKLLNNEDVDLTEGIYLYDWNYIDDTIKGLVLAAEKGFKDEIYYIGNSFRWPLKKIIFETKSILSSKSRINIGKFDELYHLDYSSIDVHKLYNHTGYFAEFDFDQAIKNTSLWVKSIIGILENENN